MSNDITESTKWNYPKELTQKRETSDMGTTNAAQNRKLRKEFRQKIKAIRHAKKVQMKALDGSYVPEYLRRYPHRPGDE